MAIRTYRDLIAWQKAMDFAESVFRLTESFPKRETYGIASHIRKTALSVPSNITEGQGRGATNDYIRFLRIARGSLQELETQILLAIRFGYVNRTDETSLLVRSEEVSRLISGLMRSLKKS